MSFFIFNFLNSTFICFNVFKALFCKSFISSKACFSLTGRFKLDDTKFIKKDLLSMFLIANEASEGIFGFLLIISSDKSFIESIVALNFELVFPGFSSG